MPRLIDADALMKALNGVEVEWYMDDHGVIGDTYDTSTVVDIIAAQPTIEAEPVPRWIPVTERLPKDWEPVLAWSKFGFCDVSVYLGNPGKWRITWNHDLLEVDSITHWMPLPEPPGTEQP